MNWNRDLDQIEAKTLHDLKAKGFTSVDKKHIIHFREIYDFISRFADDSYHGNVRLRMTNGEVPRETMRIVNTIGPNNLWAYFSPNVYPKRFIMFCEKLIRSKRIVSSDYVAEGVIIAEDYQVEVYNYDV